MAIETSLKRLTTNNKTTTYESQIFEYIAEAMSGPDFVEDS